MNRILAFDGALLHTGWVVIDYNNDNLKIIDYGIARPKTNVSLGFKLFHIRETVKRLFNRYKPSTIIFEETFAGKNAKTTARLNNAKGAFYVTAYELLNKKDPVYISNSTVRSCLGLASKREVYNHFKKLYKIDGSFKASNDITDAIAIGVWFIFNERDECVKRSRQSKEK